MITTSSSPQSLRLRQALAEAAVDDTAQPATISSIYDGSLVKNFRLRSFYFGCLATANITNPFNGQVLNNVPQPANCTVTVTGTGGKSDKVTRFDYTPLITSNRATGTNKSTMTPADLPQDFKKLQTVSLTASFRGRPPAGIKYNEALPGLKIDSVFYTTHNFTMNGLGQFDVNEEDDEDEGNK